MLEFSGEERQAICDTFDRVLSDNANEEALRKLIETESGFDNSLWQKMAELGLTGLMVDPDYDGIGGQYSGSRSADGSRWQIPLQRPLYFVLCCRPCITPS